MLESTPIIAEATHTGRRSSHFAESKPTSLSSHGHYFTINLPNSTDLKVIDSLHFKQEPKENRDRIVNIQPNVVIIYNNHKDENEKDDEDVSPELVTKFNTHIGNFENQKKAKILIEKMRRLAGLIPSAKNEPVDIPAARIGLSILAGLNNQTLKMQALDNLILLLKNDKLEKETSVSLVTLALHLMNKMNRILIQTEIVDVQIKIAEAYSIVAELLQRHYSKKHINGITKELKLELIDTAKALEALNTHEDAKLDFYVSEALEGIRRLIDDRKELFDLIERFYHAGAAMVTFYRYDPASSLQELALIFKELDPSFPNAWYNGILILRDLARQSKTDVKKLISLQALVRQKYRSFDWKFSYAALDILHELTLYGKTKQIRKIAFEGIKVLGPDFPGLISFVNSKDLAKQLDLTPILHFHRPKRKNPNIEIRRAAIENLIHIAKTTHDPSIRKKAKSMLLLRSRIEEEQSIRTQISEMVPNSTQDLVKWLKEETDNLSAHVVRIHRNQHLS